MERKKLWLKIGAILLSMLSLFLMTGCGYYNRMKENAVKDGLFKYFYLKEDDAYAIVGDGDEIYPETVAIPSHYKGKEITEVYYRGRGTYLMLTPYYGPNLVDVETVYYPYTSNLEHMDLFFENNTSCYPAPSRFVFCCNATVMTSYERLYEFSGLSELLCSPNLYEKIKGYKPRISTDRCTFTEKNNYILKNLEVKCIKANTSYLFNYEGAPNDGYFFINDFERGGLIENTPYEPIRAGYTFGGWYKESECINIWNFEVDTLPTAEYDSEGYVTEFVETRLYAKWNKM